MIVKILASSATFGGVRYNTNKIETGKGELMLVRNFGALQGLTGLRPEDYRNYLKMVSATNKAVNKPQFHTAISAEGRSYDKQALTEIAEKWLAKMGYSDQPYLVVFHKDTDNNHVHIISTRIDRQGKKINSGFENIRALKNLTEVLGLDEKHTAKHDIEKALAYCYSTKAQWMMILECQGYKLAEKDGEMLLVRFGKVQAAVSLKDIIAGTQRSKPPGKRAEQLRALFHKYAPLYSTAGFADYLKAKHGIVLLLHAKNGKPAYGYSVIDNASKIVFKGGDIMPLSALLQLNPSDHSQDKRQDAHRVYKESIPEQFRRDYYKAILKTAMNNYADIRQGLHHTGIGIYWRDDRFYLLDHADKAFIPLDQLLTAAEYDAVIQAFARSGELTAEVGRQYMDVPVPVLSASVDDEAVNGRNRRRRRHPRTDSGK